METAFYPTPQHREVAEIITAYFAQNELADTVLLTNSIARGKAVAESDLDMVVLLKPDTNTAQKQWLEPTWQHLSTSHPVLVDFVNAHSFLQFSLT